MRKKAIEALKSILEAREQRAILKTQIAGNGFSSVSLSLNVPGFPKSNPVAKAFFDLCLKDLKYYLKAHLIDIQHLNVIEGCDAAGDFFIAPFSNGIKSMGELKQLCEDFELDHQLGRFIDLDLNDLQGNTVSSGKSKLCFLCNERPAIVCRRENTHDTEQLRSFMFSKMGEYCNRQREIDIAKKLSALGLRALLYEISLCPKPGLVDKFSNGSHRDMNYQTFLDSSAAISPWFEELVHAGFNFSDEDLKKALPKVRNLGLRMESAMFEATGKVNTQKGIIFLLGLSLFACGRLFSQNDQFNVEKFSQIVSEICKDMVSKELGLDLQQQATHGMDIFQRFGYSGARGEAESGFRTVIERGLPQLMQESILTDQSMIKSFLSIAANNMDTNILYRGGPAVLTEFQSLCQIALSDFKEGNYQSVIHFCEKENISPGGSADLLVLTIFVGSVMAESFSPIVQQ